MESHNHIFFRFYTGFLGAYKLTKYFDFQLALSYTGKGGAGVANLKFLYDPNLPDVDITYRLKLDYLQTRALIHIFPGKDRQFFFTIGGYVAYLMSAKIQATFYQAATKIGEETVDIKDNNEKLSKIDAGMTAGYNYEFKTGLCLHLLSDIGFKRVEKNIGNTISITPSVSYNLAKLLK